MSFRGFQKSVVRAPQQFKQKFNLGEHTKDPVYIDSERRFQELETETKRLHDESKKYFEAINGMLQHQIEFSKAMTEIYKPISGRMSDPDSLVPHGNYEGIAACEEYEAVVKDLQETLAPELEMIEARVIRPANELLDVIKVIRKTAVKREHKKLDYDRHRATLKKLQDKKDRSAKDEKAMWKAENEVEQATQEYNYFNDLLKDELPKLFALERQFIQPLFQSFYYMQLNIFYTLHEKMQHCDIGYFDLTLDIEEAFYAKRGDVQERAEALSIVKFKTTGMKRPPKYQRPGALEGNKPAGLLTAGSSTTTSTGPPEAAPSVTAPRPWEQQQAAPAVTAPRPWETQAETVEAHAPPPYSVKPSTLHATPASYAAPVASPKPSSLSMAAAAKAKPPPPKPKPKALMAAAPKVETVTALYDYSAQAEGDLSFRAGDVIEIVTRTANENEWWIGKLHGKQGQFPVIKESLSARFTSQHDFNLYPFLWTRSWSGVICNHNTDSF
ncbi:BAR domain-containing protein [Neurospora hispaniola]|uniref:BAR domain-containing protein n=1 Tax=Neurospora hispaniola TaxID=588809 RepID=A0AAJ0MV83_9PEZI|nr:BAR domain-containing protein [Neurospora hispaniola]